MNRILFYDFNLKEISVKSGSSRFGKETLLYLKLKKNTQDPKFVEAMKWNEINIVREVILKDCFLKGTFLRNLIFK